MKKGLYLKRFLIGLSFFICGILNSCTKEDSVTILPATESEADGDSLSGDSTVENNAETSQDTSSEEKDVSQQEHIFVYVCGEVNCPGVYECQPEARVYDAIDAAGGMTDNAAPTAINLAEHISDGQMITVFSLDQVTNEGLTGESTAIMSQSFENNTDQKVNINTADADTLMTLPGIGSSKASAIITYREQNKGFSSIEEVMNIEGIKEGVYNKIKDLITVN